MLSFTNASTALVPATADVGEVELLTHKRWYHGSRPLRYFLSVTFRPRTTPLTDPRHEHELMCSVVGSPGGRELVMKLYQKHLAA